MAWATPQQPGSVTPLDAPRTTRHIGRVTVQTDETCPQRVGEYAGQAAEYVLRAIGTELEYDSDTLPLLDHYLRTVATDNAATLELVVTTAGSYFGEVVRRQLGGRWEGIEGDPHDWRVVLPTGLNVSQSGIVAAANVRKDDIDGFDTRIDAPPGMLTYVEQALARMGHTTKDDYFSLCGRLDTLEHLQEVLVAVAAQLSASN